MNRREFGQVTLAAGVAIAASTTISLAELGPHPFHEFLTDVGIDSTTAPRDLKPLFKDSNRSILHVEAQGKSFSVDARNRGGQTQKQVHQLIRDNIVSHFGAKPVAVPA